MISLISVVWIQLCWGSLLKWVISLYGRLTVILFGDSGLITSDKLVVLSVPREKSKVWAEPLLIPCWDCHYSIYKCKLLGLCEEAIEKHGSVRWQVVNGRSCRNVVVAFSANGCIVRCWALIDTDIDHFMRANGRFDEFVTGQLHYCLKHMEYITKQDLLSLRCPELVSKHLKEFDVCLWFKTLYEPKMQDKIFGFLNRASIFHTPFIVFQVLCKVILEPFGHNKPWLGSHRQVVDFISQLTLMFLPLQNETDLNYLLVHNGRDHCFSILDHHSSYLLQGWLCYILDRASWGSQTTQLSVTRVRLVSLGQLVLVVGLREVSSSLLPVIMLTVKSLINGDSWLRVP